MGLPERTYDPVKIVDPYEVKYNNVISKNIANKEVLTKTIQKFTDVLDEPSIETFENAGERKTCNFHIENKCYDQYLEVDKIIMMLGHRFLTTYFHL